MKEYKSKALKFKQSFLEVFFKQTSRKAKYFKSLEGKNANDLVSGLFCFIELERTNHNYTILSKLKYIDANKQLQSELAQLKADYAKLESELDNLRQDYYNLASDYDETIDLINYNGAK